ncbi:S-type pyocin domain-containing protein [Streptomyces sp. NPDC050703]|uniref:S-type pyocin domain-containing protein n=1 Tax=Streptomyces sp. NPDC050703 TaxID=3157218 RepID=UPI00341C81FE
MRAEENGTDKVVAFPRPRETAETAVADRAVPDTGRAAEASSPLVLNAERGIINTGIVHGGQHVTAIEFSGHADGGDRGDF